MFKLKLEHEIFHQKIKICFQICEIYSYETQMKKQENIQLI